MELSVFWALFVIGIVLIFLFAVIPSLFESRAAHDGTITWVPVEPTHSPATVQHDEQSSKQSLDAQFMEARSTIPEDYPVKPIGACPYTKAPSSDLPMVDMPLCLVASGKV